MFVLRIELAGMGPDELDDFPVALGRLFLIASGLADHAEPIVAVRHLGIACQQLAGRRFRLIEFARVHQIHHGIGGGIQRLCVIERFGD